MNLFTDRDGEAVASLVLHDVEREPRDIDPELADVKHLTENHAALWQCIRSRKAKGEVCNRAVLRDDIIAMEGENGRKAFTRWLNKLVKDGLIKIDDSGEVIMLKG